MEDAHISTTDLVPLDGSHVYGDNVCVFGVFDGHGGKEVAKFCQVYFLRELTQIPEFCDRQFGIALKKCFHRMDEMIESEEYEYQLQQFRKIPNPSDRKPSTADETEQRDSDDGTVSPPKTNGKKIPLSEALVLFQKLLTQQQDAKRADNVTLTPMSQTTTPQPTPPMTLEDTNQESDTDASRERKESLGTASAGAMICRLPDHRITAGCTACVALKHGNHLYVANAGDSRAVLCRGDGSAYALSQDHKPNDRTELDRIVAAGGFVNQVGRVNGNLNLSRAIGDLKYKQSRHLSRPEQIISGDPDVSITQISPDDKFFMIACDGVWDCFSNQEAVTFILQRIEQGMDLLKIIEEVFDFCVSVDPRNTGGIGGDNMTCLIVQLNCDTTSAR